MIAFIGFKLPDFMAHEYPSLLEADRARDRHLPMFRLLKSMEEHRDIPQTFGGELPSYMVPGPDGHDVEAELTQAVVMDTKAHGVMRDAKTGKHWLGTFEMTPEELADYKRHPDTYFGVYQQQGRRAETAMDMFDFFAEAYEHTPKEKLIAMLPNYPDQQKLQQLSQKELVKIAAERYTYGAMQSGFKPKTRDELRAERSGFPPRRPKAEK
jgi:hypothetical protein